MLWLLGAERLTADLVSELCALQREKWVLAFNHIRGAPPVVILPLCHGLRTHAECEAAQRRDRHELVAALVEARSSRAGTQRRAGPRSRYRTHA